MVHTIHTRSVHRGCGREHGRRRGRGCGGRMTPYGLGLNGGSKDSHRTSMIHNANRSSGNQTKGSGLIHTTDTSSRAPCHRESSYDPSEEYTPSSPKTYELEEKIETLRGEIGELRDRLSMSDATVVELTEKLETLKRAYIKLTHVVLERNKLKGERNLLKLKLAQERRIAARSWRTRIRDRTRFCRIVTSKYTGVVRGCFEAWVHNFKMGPMMNPMWSFKPSLTFAQYIRDLYLSE